MPSITPVAILPSFLEDSVKERRELFVQGSIPNELEWVVTEERVSARELLRRILHERKSRLGPGDLPLFYQEFEGFCHDLKYLFYKEDSPSSWFFENPYEGEERVIESRVKRSAKVRRHLDKIDNMIGGEAECTFVERLRQTCGLELAEFLKLVKDPLNGKSENWTALREHCCRSIAAQELRTKLEAPSSFYYTLWQ